jgi:arachidonate 5-lipoxygenase
MAAPECYFYMIADPQHIYSTGDSCLLPIAIRLDPSDLSAPVFTPDDDTWDWITAKAFVANADAQYHMAVSYYLKVDINHYCYYY